MDCVVSLMASPPDDLKARKDLLLFKGDDDRRIYDCVVHTFPQQHFEAVPVSDIWSRIPADLLGRETWVSLLSDFQCKLTPEFLAARLHHVWSASHEQAEPQEALRGSLDDRLEVVTRALSKGDQNNSLWRIGHAQACYHLAILYHEKRPIGKENLRSRIGNPENKAKAQAERRACCRVPTVEQRERPPEAMSLVSHWAALTHSSGLGAEPLERLRSTIAAKDVAPDRFRQGSLPGDPAETITDRVPAARDRLSICDFLPAEWRITLALTSRTMLAKTRGVGTDTRNIVDDAFDPDAK
ncbi:hypothetical protein B0T14DRAFT_561341 [Immersiella caudata]|uniref:Uncharacterized protein n=1 Tax=Immersiella caudata TaxID=314043 RepID=A0AA39XIN4_9PEZI|nr:hypothetical protein B0T14DRAFT_561341 [Immersiella caudata]